MEALRPDHELAEELGDAIIALGGRRKGHSYDVLGSELFRQAEPET